MRLFWEISVIAKTSIFGTAIFFFYVVVAAVSLTARSQNTGVTSSVFAWDYSRLQSEPLFFFSRVSMIVLQFFSASLRYLATKACMNMKPRYSASLSKSLGVFRLTGVLASL